jgi:hypothetical protein
MMDPSVLTLIVGDNKFLINDFHCIRRPRRRWVDNIRMDLGEVGCGDVDWIGLAQDRNRWRAAVNSLLNLLQRSGLCNSRKRITALK